MAQITRIPPLSPHAGLEAKLLATRAGALQPHEFLSYTEMDAVTGVKVQEHRHILDTARLLARHIYGKEFEVIRDHGWRCLTEAGKLGKSDRELQRTHRHMGRIKDILDCVDPAVLTPLEKHTWLCELSITAGVQLMTHPKTLQQLETGAAPPALPWDYMTAKDLFA
jgi:hypothetical protein